MTIPSILTLSAFILTLEGDVPLETWFPLIGDILSNFGGMILKFLGVA